MPKAYIIEIVVTPIDNDEVNDLALYLQSGNTEFIAVLSKDKTCLIPIDGKDPRSHGAARKGAVFTNDEPNTIVYTVHEDKLEYPVDGDTVFEWKEYAPPLTSCDQPFALGCSGCTFRFDRIAITPLDE